ncbi:alkaline phosphatase [Roseateles sp. LKC17W]|uniref:Alkaline phosphatase n=1 Tax=Pelomonas margarita TaxID=3299031 RepID=A0ABW7FLD4_9BURK
MTARALSVAAAGRHEFSVEATQADGQKVVAKGNFDIVPFTAAMGPKVKNIIILLGDATPAGNAVHTSNGGACTGIVDQFFDDRAHTGLTVLMGGGRKWFLPAGTPGSARTDSNDYVFSATDAHTADIVKRWGAAPGNMDKGRDLIADFQRAGFGYAATKADLDRADAGKPLLGLFAFSNMNVALDKINGRCGTRQ